jgi:general secretion pathway protein D
LVEAQGFEFIETEEFLRIVQRERTANAPARGQRPAMQEPVRLFVVRLRHARAADVAATVNQLFGAAGAFAGSGGLSGGTLSDQLRDEVGSVRTDQPSAQTGAQRPEGANLTGPVTVVPDQLTNSLLVRATEGDFDVLTQAIEQLDVRPLQVLIEVLIVEARKDRRSAAGIDAVLPPRNLEGGTIEGAITTSGLGDLVVRVMSLGKYQIDALLTAARQRGDVRIVSRPVLVASNNTESRLLVGSQRPFVSVSRSLPTDSPSRDQVVQFRDVGTKLTVRPTINQDGYVSLLIQQEISAATEETQFDAPVISTRETLTQVLVADGQTIVLGGLTDRQRDETRRGVPLLVDLPIIGGLFGGTTTRTIETELFLFITPTILNDDADADRVTRERLPHEDVAPRAPADTTANEDLPQRGLR